MSKLIVEVFDKKNSPVISLDRDIILDDFQNVDERNNAEIFIFGDDDKGWTQMGNKQVLKIRFCMADELKEKLEKYLTQAQIKSYAMNLWKVHRFEVKENEATEAKEDELKGAVKKLIESSIQMINYIADTKF
jgi:hypothetical protein